MLRTQTILIKQLDAVNAVAHEWETKHSDLMDKARDLKVDRDRYWQQIFDCVRVHGDRSNLGQIADEGLQEVEL